MNNIAIDCKGFNDLDKKYIQEAFFKLGYRWDVPGYMNLERNGYAVDNGKLSYFFGEIDGETKRHLNHLNFLTFNELMELAGLPWRNIKYGEPSIRVEPKPSWSDIRELTKQSAKVDIIGADEASQPKADRSKPRNKYDREIVPGVFVDVYDVLGAFKTCSPSIDHAVKKLLAPGKRGHKDRVTDLKEAIASIEREIEKINEWSK